MIFFSFVVGYICVINSWSIENRCISLKCFFCFVVKNTYVFVQKKSHFRVKLACLERKKTRNFFPRDIFPSQSVCYTYQAFLCEMEKKKPLQRPGFHIVVSVVSVVSVVRKKFRTDRIHSISYKKLYLSFLLY